MDTIVLSHETEAITETVRWVVVGHVHGPNLPFEPHGVHVLHEGRYLRLVLAFTEKNNFQRVRLPALATLENVTEKSLVDAIHELAHKLFEWGYKGEAAIASAQSVWRIRAGHAEKSSHSYTVIGERADAVESAITDTLARVPHVGVQGLIVHGITKAWGTSVHPPVCRLTRHRVTQ